MPGPAPEQVVALGMIKEAIPAAPAPNSAAEMAQRLDKKHAEENYKDRFTRTTGAVDEKQASEKFEQIGTKRDDITGEKKRTPTSKEGKRFAEVTKDFKVVKKFLEEGPSAFPPGTPERTNMLKAIGDKLRNRAAFATELASLGAGADATLERYLNDPEFAAEIRAILVETTNPDNLMIDEESINTAQDEATQKENERDSKQEEVTDTERRLNKIDVRLKSFDPAGALTAGTKANRIMYLKTNMSTLISQRDGLKTTTRTLEGELGKFEKQMNAFLGGTYTARTEIDIQGDINTTKTALETARNEELDRQAQIEELPALEQEEQKLEEDRKEIAKEQRDRDLELKKLDLELSQKKRVLAERKAVRESEEQGLVDKMKNIFSEGADRLIEKRVAQISTKLDEELTTLKGKTESQDKQALYDGLRNELHREEIRKGFLGLGQEHIVHPIDRTKVNTYWRSMIDSGPIAGMKDMLMTQKNPATGANYSGPEADAILADSTYVAEMQSEYVKQIVAKRMLVGKIYPEDIDIITNSTWGQTAIKDSIDVNTKTREDIEAVMGAGAIEKHGFFDRLSNEMKKRPSLLALLLLGPLAVAVAAGSALKQQNVV